MSAGSAWLCIQTGHNDYATARGAPAPTRLARIETPSFNLADDASREGVRGPRAAGERKAESAQRNMAHEGARPQRISIGEEGKSAASRTHVQPRRRQAKGINFPAKGTRILSGAGIPATRRNDPRSKESGGAEAPVSPRASSDEPSA